MLLSPQIEWVLFSVPTGQTYIQKGLRRSSLKYHKPRKVKWLLRELIWIEKTKTRRLAKKTDCGKKRTMDIVWYFDFAQRAQVVTYGLPLPDHQNLEETALRLAVLRLNGLSCNRSIGLTASHAWSTRFLCFVFRSGCYDIVSQRFGVITKSV